MADELDTHWVDLHKDWRLNEKHYGAIQGHKKDIDLSKKLCAKSLKVMRDSFDGTGPGMNTSDFRHPVNDQKYSSSVHPEALPAVESMRDCMNRTLSFWEEHIVQSLRADKQVLIISHKNTLKALFTHIQGLHDDDFKKVDVPNAVPIIFEFDKNLKFLQQYNLDASCLGSDPQDQLSSLTSSEETDL